jgi:hypothetical protein
MCDPCEGLDRAGIWIDLIVAFWQSLAKATSAAADRKTLPAGVGSSDLLAFGSVDPKTT